MDLAGHCWNSMPSPFLMGSAIIARNRKMPAALKRAADYFAHPHSTNIKTAKKTYLIMWQSLG